MEVINSTVESIKQLQNIDERLDMVWSLVMCMMLQI